MSCYYNKPQLYLDSYSDTLEKIEAYNKLIDAMMVAAEKMALNADVDEYWLDDGQTKIKNIYRTPDDVLSAISNLEKLRQIYINRYNGHGTVLRDRNSLKPC